MNGRPTHRQRSWPVTPVPLLWLVLVLVLLVAVFGVAAQVAWVYSGPELCAPVMPAVEHCFVADRWSAIRGGLVLVGLVTIAAMATIAATTRTHWHVTCLSAYSLAVVLIAVLTTS